MPRFNPANYEGLDRLAHIETFLRDRLDLADRDSLAKQRQGLVVETGSRMTQASAGAATGSGTLRMGAMAMREGDTLTTSWVGVSTNATAPSLAQSAVYLCDAPLVASLVASSADFSGWISSGTTPRGASAAMSAAWVAPSDGYYLVGVLQVAGTTATIATVGANSAGSWQVGSSPPPSGALTAQTSLATSFAYSSLVANSIMPWVGFS